MPAVSRRAVREDCRMRHLGAKSEEHGPMKSWGRFRTGSPQAHATSDRLRINASPRCDLFSVVRCGACLPVAPLECSKPLCARGWNRAHGPKSATRHVGGLARTPREAGRRRAYAAGVTATPVPLIDPFARRVRDLRLSVTDRCNFRCTYCMPEEGMQWLPRSELLTYEELARVARVCVERWGFDGIRITGGEPTVRAHLPRLFELLAPARRRSGDDHERGPAAGARPRSRGRGPAAGQRLARHASGPRRSARSPVATSSTASSPGIDAALDAGLVTGEDQLRRDPRRQRRRGRRPRRVRSGPWSRGALHRVHAARRAG